MKMLETLFRERAFDQEVSYTDNVALSFQPLSYSEFHRHPEFPEVFARWTRNDKSRGLDFVRIWAMALNCKQCLESGPGAVAELGVYQGQSAALLALYAERYSRNIYLFDTFAGFPEPQYEADMSDGKKAAFKDISLEAAKEVVGGYPGIRWIVGAFPDSVTEEMRQDTYAFVSLDCDIYEPICRGLEFFWPRMQPGGVIFIHDYSSGHWPGATRAVDEFCAREGVAGCLLPDYGGSYVLARGRTK